MTVNNESNITSEPHQDYFLQNLVALVNKTNLDNIGVILNVRGLIVSGKLVSEQSYLKEISIEIVAKNIHEHLRDDLLEGFQNIAHEAHELNISEERSHPNKSSPEFIHLKDAHMYADSQRPIPDNKGIWWRGRISAVDGFSIGLLF